MAFLLLILVNDPLQSDFDLAEILSWRAQHQADRLAFQCELPGVRAAAWAERWQEITYFDLHARAQGVANEMREQGVVPGRVLLAFDSGVDFVASFFGCLYAGVVAVPIPVPSGPSGRLRWQQVVRDADPRMVLTNARHREAIQALGLDGLRVGLVDGLKDESVAEVAHAKRTDKLAFLQYTSGSTADPKGVAITFGNLSSNLEQIRRRFGHSPASRGVIWLPPFHDMGLIGGILQPIYAGFPVALIRPQTFVRHPFRWLEAISEFRATTSGGPTFAYGHALKRISAERRTTLDLSSWSVAFVGAERVRPGVLQEFAQGFRACGFQESAFLPCYGLAESTLMVSAGLPGTGLRLGTDSSVSCGPIADDLEVRIVAPETKEPLGQGSIGEIWVSGASVAKGYWGHDGKLAEAFEARLADWDETMRFFRTGDLGYLRDGELYVSGRLKDLIVIRGQNYLPNDLEDCVIREADLPADSVVAFAVDDGQGERLVVLCEMRRRRGKSLPVTEVGAAIRGAVSTTFSLVVDEIAVVKSGGLPRTTSGKLRRAKCREMYVAGELPSLARVPVVDRENPVDEGSLSELEEVIRGVVAQHLKVDPGRLDSNRPLAELGVDSVMAVEIAAALSEQLKLSEPLEPTLAWRYPTVAALSEYLGIRRADFQVCATNSRASSDPIAIVGLSCRFPGGADSPQSFWQLLMEGRDVVSKVPIERWDADAFYDPDPDVQGKMYTREGAFIGGVADFDPEFFNISPREANLMDPQQRLLLEGSYLALTDAGYDPFQLRGSRTGVFVGLSLDDYAQLTVRSGDASRIDQQSSLGALRGVAAGRIAYVLGLEGPVMQLDTTCSSSLVSVHLACQLLRQGEADLALAGGVNLMLTPEASIACCKLRALSPDGRCFTFSEQANGYVRGEGCGMVVLQRLSDAVAQERPIYGVVRGSMVNHDGLSNGLTAPNVGSQINLYQQALQSAGLKPDEIDYLETHGTGTPLGDPIEIEGIDTVFGGRSSKLLIGSVKTNVGHLESAAGIVSLIKTLIAMQEGTLPPHLHADELSSRIDWDRSCTKVVTEACDWPEGIRRAGVSSFGLSGTNAHVILERPVSNLVRKSFQPVSVPFMRRRCWVGLDYPGEPIPLKQLPLVGGRQYCFEGLIRAEDWTGHRVQGRTLLPATGQLWFVTRALNQIEADTSWVVRDTELRAPLWLDGEAVSVQLQFARSTEDELEFEFYGRIDGGWQELSRGRCAKTFETTERIEGPSEGRRIEAGEFYDRCASHGLDYDGAFRQLSHIDLGNDTVRGMIGSVAHSAAVWDLGLQVAGTLLGGDSLVVPAHVAAFREHRLDATNGTSVLARRLGKQFDIQWLDKDHSLVAELTGLSLLPMGASSRESESPYFEIVWEEMPADLWPTEGLDLEEEIEGDSVIIVERPEFAVLILPRVPAEESVPSVCARVMAELLSPVQAFLRSGHDRRLYVVGWGLSSGDELVNAAAWGLLQTVSIEHPEVCATFIVGDEWDSIGREILAQSDALRVRIARGRRQVARWAEVSPLERLVIESPGALANLRRAPQEALEPKSDEVLISVEAAGLNFRDVLVAMGLYPEAAELGCECAGVVAATGAGITDLKPGDRVMAIGEGCFSDAIAVERSMVVPIPDGLDMGNAAALPVAHCTAYHSLVRLAKLQPGETVLIHSATGGVGQVAIRLAQSIGARVFATASPQKWPKLKDLGISDIYHSRTGEFAESVLAATENRGVDVVLNSLPGEGRQRSLDATAKGGRFIEIGKGNGMSPEEIRSSRPDVSHYLFDLSALCREEPERVQMMLVDACSLGTFGDDDGPVTQTFAWEDVTEAFRRMQSGQQVGKLVVKRNQIGANPAVSPVLITGGLGGLGLVTAEWLIDRGVRHLLLLSRNGAQLEEQQRAVDRLRTRGATVDILKADVANHTQLAGVLKPYLGLDSNTALRGVIHAAGALSAGLIETQTPQTVHHSFGPKVAGAWNLHQLTEHLALEYFVLYSSAAGVFGAPGQANHAAANAFLDGLARTRVNSGLRGLSIAWGPWSGVGSAVVYGEAGFLREIPGVRMIHPEDAEQYLDAAWASKKPVLTVLPVDWSRFDADRWNVAFHRKPLVTHRIPIPAEGTAGTEVRSADELERLVVNRIARVLGIAGSELDREKGFFDLGIDSLTGLEIKTQLERELGFKLPTTLIFDYPTPVALLGYLRNKVAGNGERQSRQREVVSMKQGLSEPIAIIGLSCRFPGGCENPSAFWEFLAEGRDGIGPAPADRWVAEDFQTDFAGEPGKIINNVGGFLENLDQFDASFFNITPKEAATMDPQQRLLLEGSWEAMTNAGVAPDDWSGKPVGVFVGISGQDYSRRLMEQPREAIDAYLATGNSHSVAAGRLSYTFGFTGPSFAIDTACSSSLVAVHQACQSLRANECEAAIAAGVNCILTPDLSITFSQAQMLSATGKCHTFAAAADGFVRSEGCGTVVLKRLSDAQADGDNILALVRGSAINQDGRSSGLTVPNGPAQQAVIRSAMAQAGVEPKDVCYVEAHGTGTKLGDPVELNALGEVFRASHSAERPLLVGSLKTNLGHMEAAAGIGGLLKVVLAFQHQALPRHLHFDAPSAHVDWDRLPIRVTDTLEPLTDGAQYAGVSSFGFSGTNAHVVIERAGSTAVRQSVESPFRRRRHWVDVDSPQRLGRTVRHPLLANELELARGRERFYELSDEVFRNPLWQEHRVFDQPVFPAVGFLELFLAALRDADSGEVLTLKDVSFVQVLSLGERRGPLQLVVGEERVELLQKGGDGVWALISSAIHARKNVAQTSASARRRSGKPVDVASVYRRLSGQGVTYGERWRVIDSLVTWESEVEATLCRQSPTAAGLHFDPVVLDACVQSTAALFVDDTKSLTYLPEGVGEVTFWRRELPGSVWTSHVRITTGDDWLSADIVLRDESETPLVTMKDFRFRPVDSRWRENLLARQALQIEDWFYLMEWRPHAVSQTTDVTFSSLTEEFTQRLGEPDNQEYLERLPDLDRYAAALAGKAIGEIERESVVPAYRSMLQRLDEMAVESSEVRSNGLADTFAIELGVLERVAERLPQILTGKCEAMDVLFPGGDTTELTWLYEKSPGARLLNAHVLGVVENLCQSANHSLRVLEVGGGTGGTTSALVSVFKNLSEYCFTDISPVLVHRAKERFGSHAVMSFKALDIEQALGNQGFGEQTFDIIVAANVLHATKRLPETLDRLNALMAPGGWLVLLEGTQPMLWLDLIFGITKGWWAFDDHLRSKHPLLDEDSWNSALVEHGFEVLSVTDCALPHAVFVAQKDRASDLPEEVLVDVSNMAGGLEDRVRGGVEKVLQSTQSVIQAGPPWPQLTLVTQGAVGPNCHSPEQAAVWGLGRTIELEYPELRCRRVDLDPLLTREEQSGVVELERMNRTVGAVSYRNGQRLVARLERPESIPRLALSTDEGQVPRSDSQVCCVGDFQIRKADAGKDASGAFGGPAPSESDADLETCDMVPVRPTFEENVLEMVPLARCIPGGDGVEIRVEAVGFNFIDGLDIAGLLPFKRDWIGVECAGEIVAVGSQVKELKVGDRVIALAPGTFKKYVTTSWKLVMKWDRDLATDATTLPANYLTAAYALREVGKVRPGERVLIHAAAGGTGLAAVQVAKSLGAEVFATASRGKWQFLKSISVEHVMDSRRLDFAEQIQTLTDGQGVDVVLNSLSGDYIHKGLQSLAPKGRFLELGKRGIWSQMQVAEVRDDVEYHVVDLMSRSEAIARGDADQPDALFDNFAPGDALPKTVFPAEEAPRAARYFQRSRHIGKVVLNFGGSPQLVRDDASYIISGGLGGLGIETCKWLLDNGARCVFLLGRNIPDALPSGLNGLVASGRVVFGTEGAKVADYDNVAHPWKAARRSGQAVVVPVQCDVSNVDDVARAIECAQSFEPLRGVIHAAGVLSDATIAELDWEKMEAVVKPKIFGAQNLHEQTKRLPLDLFVLYSSGASLLGSPGQGAHVAANAYLDALAHHRRALGLPAQSLNWGPWSRVGSAAGDSTQRTLADRGIGHIDPVQGLAALSLVLQRPDWAQVGVLPVDWSNLELQGLLDDSFYANLRAGVCRQGFVGNRAERSKTGDWFTTLSALPAGQRHAALVGLIQFELGRVIGLPDGDKPDPNVGFFDMGIDSLMSVDLKNRLARHLDLEISPTVIFQNPNINVLASALIDDRFDLKTRRVKPDKDDRSVGEQESESRLLVSETSVESAIESELRALDELLED